MLVKYCKIEVYPVNIKYLNGIYILSTFLSSVYSQFLLRRLSKRLTFLYDSMGSLLIFDEIGKLKCEAESRLKEAIRSSSYFDSAVLLSSLIQLIPFIKSPSSKSISIFEKWYGVLLVLESWEIKRSWVIGKLVAISGIISECILTSIPFSSKTVNSIGKSLWTINLQFKFRFIFSLLRVSSAEKVKALSEILKILFPTNMSPFILPIFIVSPGLAWRIFLSLIINSETVYKDVSCFLFSIEILSPTFKTPLVVKVIWPLLLLNFEILPRKTPILFDFSE